MQNEDKKGDGGTANHAPFRRDNTLAVCAMGQKVTQGRANRHEREKTPESSADPQRLPPQIAERRHCRIGNRLAERIAADPARLC